MLKEVVNQELRLAAQFEAVKDPAQAFYHLERAHILGQYNTRLHVLVHWRMFIWGLKHNDKREIIGQVLRLVAAATKTAFGLIPEGNSGGANISPFKSMPIPDDLKAILAKNSASH
jgi:hypothetical protein